MVVGFLFQPWKIIWARVKETVSFTYISSKKIAELAEGHYQTCRTLARYRQRGRQDESDPIALSRGDARVVSHQRGSAHSSSPFTGYASLIDDAPIELGPAICVRRQGNQSRAPPAAVQTHREAGCGGNIFASVATIDRLVPGVD